MSDEFPMISLVKKGSPEFPRYALAKSDEFRNPIYWSGLTWTANESDAVLYSDVTQALWTYNDLLTDALEDLPCHRYVAPLYIEIYGEKPPPADLRKWLERAMHIVVDSTKHGLGPKGTVGVVIADVGETRSV